MLSAEASGSHGCSTVNLEQRKSVEKTHGRSDPFRIDPGQHFRSRDCGNYRLAGMSIYVCPSLIDIVQIIDQCDRIQK